MYFPDLFTAIEEKSLAYVLEEAKSNDENIDAQVLCCGRLETLIERKLSFDGRSLQIIWTYR